MIYKLGSICIPAPAPAGDRGACLPTCTDSHKRGRSAHLRTHRHTYMPPASKKHAPRSRARARRRRPADLHGFRRGAPAGGGQVSNNNRASKAKQRSKGREAFEQPLLLQQSKAEEERGEADKSLGRFVGQAGGAEKRIAHPTSSCYLPDCAAIIQSPVTAAPVATALQEED